MSAQTTLNSIKAKALVVETLLSSFVLLNTQVYFCFNSLNLNYNIYFQKKINKIDNERDTQDWDDFVEEFKTLFNNKSKLADAEWRIETFKQGRQHIAD